MRIEVNGYETRPTWSSTFKEAGTVSVSNGQVEATIDVTFAGDWDFDLVDVFEADAAGFTYAALPRERAPRRHCSPPPSLPSPFIFARVSASSACTWASPPTR